MIEQFGAPDKAASSSSSMRRIVTFERSLMMAVDLALRRQQFLVGFRGAYAGNHG